MNFGLRQLGRWILPDSKGQDCLSRNDLNNLGAVRYHPTCASVTQGATIGLAQRFLKYMMTGRF